MTGPSTHRSEAWQAPQDGFDTLAPGRPGNRRRSGGGLSSGKGSGGLEAVDRHAHDAAGFPGEPYDWKDWRPDLIPTLDVIFQ